MLRRNERKKRNANFHFIKAINIIGSNYLNLLPFVEFEFLESILSVKS